MRAWVDWPDVIRLAAGLVTARLLEPWLGEVLGDWGVLTEVLAGVVAGLASWVVLTVALAPLHARSLWRDTDTGQPIDTNLFMTMRRGASQQVFEVAVEPCIRSVASILFARFVIRVGGYFMISFDGQVTATLDSGDGVQIDERTVALKLNRVARTGTDWGAGRIAILADPNAAVQRVPISYSFVKFDDRTPRSMRRPLFNAESDAKILRAERINR